MLRFDDAQIAVIGQGNVGLPLAAELGLTFAATVPAGPHAGTVAAAIRAPQTPDGVLFDMKSVFPPKPAT